MPPANNSFLYAIKSANVREPTARPVASTQLKNPVTVRVYNSRELFLTSWELANASTIAAISAPEVRAAARVVSVVSIVLFIYSDTNVVKICFNIPKK